MVTQIVNGVYQLKVPIPNNPLENTNIYLVQGDKSYTLIDTGWDSETAFNSINRQLAEVGVGFRDISKEKKFGLQINRYTNKGDS